MMLSTLLLLSLPLKLAAALPTTNNGAASPAAPPTIVDTLLRRGAFGIPFTPVP